MEPSHDIDLHSEISRVKDTGFEPVLEDTKPAV